MALLRLLPRNLRGFTLVELLVAIAVLAIVAVLSWRGLDSMARAQAQTAERSDAALAAQAALAQWVADLDAMQPTGSDGRTQVLDWDGRALRITRRGPADDGAGVRVVAWARRDAPNGAQWLRWQSRPIATQGDWQQAWQQAAQWAQTPTTGLRDGEVAALPLAGWQVFFFRNNAWSNAFSSAESGRPGAADPTAGALPDGVRLVLELPPGPIAGRITRDWVRPTLGGEKS